MPLAPRTPVESLPRTGLTPPVQRLIALIALHFLAAILVVTTGGLISPLLSLFFLCLFLTTLFFGGVGAITSALWQLVSLVAMTQRLGTTGLYQGSRELLIEALPAPLYFLHDVKYFFEIVYVGCPSLVALLTGLIARRFLQKATLAMQQVKRERDQIEEAKWLTDTVVMMQSLYELEQVLSAALLQLTERIPAAVVAIYLCEPDEPVLHLAQSMGLPQDKIVYHQLPLSELSMLVSAYRDPSAPDNKNSAGFWQLSKGDLLDMGEWARVDERAQVVMVAPLQTWEEVSGAIYVAAHNDGVLTEDHRRLLAEFAQQVLYPIQRVRLQALATTDALTGLFNRRVFLRHLKDEVDRSRRYGPALSLLMLDIDHFKQVNDTLGHRAGDFILSQLAALLQRNTRNTDTTVRYGGEEMVILCPETRVEEATKLAERVRHAVEAYPFLLPSGETKHITVSVGVAALTKEIADGTVLMETADQALYAAKAAGRNRVSTSAVDAAP